VLIIFFIVVIIVIPYFFMSSILANEKDIGGVQIDNRKIFTDLINENMIGKQLPGMLSHSAEFSAMRVKNKEELDILKRLREKDEVRDAIPKPKDNKQVVQIKPICLLMGYMYGLIKEEDYNQEGIKEDLETILRTIPSYIDIMLSQTMMLSQAFKMGKSPKRITAKNILTLIQFSQNLMQGGWIYKDAFQQLPHVDQTLSGKLKNSVSGKTLFQYCTMTKEERRTKVMDVWKDQGEKKALAVY